jgi:hypothetical protein
MTMKKLLGSAAAFAVATTMGSAAFAQTVDQSVLARVLGDVQADIAGTATFGRIGFDGTALDALEGVLSNVAATAPTLIVGGQAINVLVDGALVTIPAGEDLLLGRIDSSVNLDFLRVGDIIQNESISTLSNGDLLETSTFFNLEGTLGDVATTAIGAVLTAADTSITVGAAQSVSESMAGGAIAAVGHTTTSAVLATNMALNTVDLDAAVNLTVEDYSLAASGISTTAIGAVGGGTITSGNIPQLERAISATVAMN